MRPDIRRMWINQPSTLQPLHALHGTNVLADCTDWGDSPSVDVWFTSGDVTGARIPALSLSDGWQPKEPTPGLAG